MRRSLMAAVLALVAAAPLEAHKPTRTRFTYHRDVFPIFKGKCGSCHRQGGVAPMSLLGYRETVPWAVSIKNQVLSLSMPPWFADERYGVFRHSSSLTASEVNTIVDWCLGGTPEGERLETPAPETRLEGAAEEPDLVLPLPEPLVLEADRGEARREARIETGLRRDRFLRGIEFRPDRPSVLRSAIFTIVPRGERPGAPVFSWIAGDDAELWPEGKGVLLPAGAALHVRLHYKKTWLDEGKQIQDRSSVALYFAKGSAKRIESLVVGSRAEEGIALSRGVEVLSLLPRVATALESLLVEAVLPNGEIRPLIRLRSPHPDWPRTYRPAEPIRLPKGSRLRVESSGPGEAPSELVLSFTGS